MNRFSYKTTKNSLLRLIQASSQQPINYSHQFERVATNHDLNSHEEFANRFFQKSFNLKSFPEA